MPRSAAAPRARGDAVLRAAKDAYAAMALSPAGVFDVVAHGLAEVLGDLVVVRVLGDDASLTPRAVRALDGGRLGIACTELETFTRSVSEPHERAAISTRKPVLIRHVPQDQLRANTPPELVQYLDESRPQSMLCVPAVHDNVARAVITLTRDFPSRPYTLEDAALVSKCAAFVGAAVVRASATQAAWQRRQEMMNVVAELGGDPADVPCDEVVAPSATAAELICSIDGRILCANESAGELGAIAVDKLIGLSVYELPVDDEQHVERELLSRMCVGELTFADADRTVLADDGTVLRLSVHRGVVRNEAAEPTALVVVANLIPVPDCSFTLAAAG
jgi:PAS domain-containing protein